MIDYAEKRHEVPSFIFLSHHEYDRKTSPCASVYQAFIGPERIADLSGYVFLELPKEQFAKELARAIDAPSPHLLFNGFQSLLRPNSIVALGTAIAKAIPITIYWHETAWNLRFLAQREKAIFKKVRELLPCIRTVNWVPTSQCLHAVATMFGYPLESFRIVYEVVDLSAFTVGTNLSPRADNAPLVVAGAGVPDDRKGIDIFSYIAASVPGMVERKVEFRWYAATPTRTRNPNIPFPSAFNWMGHSSDFNASLREVDIFLLTSRDDPSPLVVFEALAAGRPSFAFATTGFNEILPSEFIATDPEDMCHRLSSFIRDFKPDAASFRSIAERFGVNNFKNRAFSVRQVLPSNIPDLNEEIMDLYDETEVEHLDSKLELLSARTNNLLRLMKSIERQRLTADAGGRRVQHLLKEKDAIKEVVKRLTNELKIEVHRGARRHARWRLRRRWWKASPEKKLRVLVLGNAPTLLNGRAGAEIDKFDVVVRINNFRIRGFEQHVGTKTDYAVISPACMKSEELAALPLSKVFVYGSNLRDDYEKIRARLTDVSRGCMVVPPPQNILRSAIYLDAMKVEMGVDCAKNQWPSTGIVAVQWARDRFGKAAAVYVHGFDFYSDSRVLLKRYFGVTTKADGKHDFDAEREHLRQLIARNAVRIL